MRFLPWAALLFVACGPGRVEHPSGMAFGDVAVGESRGVALQLSNSGASAVHLAFTAEGDFTPDETARTLNAGETSTLLVRFAPTGLGARTGSLSIDGVAVALSGRGTGAQLSVPDEVILSPFSLITGQPAIAVTSKLRLRNTGTAGSLLRLGAPRVEGAELCVGTFDGSVCQPWTPPRELDTQSILDVPLSLLASAAGARSWTVTFPSDDRVHPEVTTEVRALVEAFEPCVFSAPTDVEIVRSPEVITIRHTGPGTCIVRDAILVPGDALQFVEPSPRLPMRLESGSRLVVAIKVGLGAPNQFTGSLNVVADGTPLLMVPLRRVRPLSNCLHLAPSSIDLGAVPKDCNSSNRNVQLYNACAEPIVIDSVTMAVAGGEGPGGPNCPGSTPCPEFFIVSGLPPGSVLAPGFTPATISVKYRPINYGTDTGALAVSVRQGTEVFLPLQGRGDSGARQVDTFRSDPLPVTDVLVMVDSSPSFVPRRASTRTNLLPLLNVLGNACHDTRWAFATADGSPDAGVRLIANDAGAVWTRSSEPAFVERALSAFDALPVGSEIEACIGPAADLMEDAGVRPGASFSGMCITDALEQSPNPMAALQRIQALGPSSWWPVAGVGSCAVEALDDGVHHGLAAAGNGSLQDICNWAYAIGGFPCGSRTHFYLNARPDGPIEVRVDGQLISANDWTWDVTSNAVQFTPGLEPRPGTTVEISYGRSCFP